MTMSTTLYKMIHDEATKTYTGPEVTLGSYSLWVEHWFECAEQLAYKFDKEQLYNTAKAVRAIIAEQKKFSREFWK